MGIRADIQYNNGGQNPSPRYASHALKSKVEYMMDYEDALREISTLPIEERREALRNWKRNNRR